MAASVITRASLVDNVTLWSAATVNSAVYDAIDSMFGGAGSYTTFEFGGAVKVTGALTPVTNDGAAIGSGTVSWADLFLASGGVINFNNGDVTITHSTNTLAFAGASTGYTFADGPVTVALGAVGTPSLTFSGDLNTGIWSPAADTIAASTGGTERMRIDTSGNVGIGVTPSSILHLRGSAPTLTLDDSGNTITTISYRPAAASYAERGAVSWNVTTGEMRISAGASGGSFFQSFYTNSTERLRITSGGDVAIGATAKLYLDGVAGAGDTYITESSANTVRGYVGGTFAWQSGSTIWYHQTELSIPATKKFYVDGGPAAGAGDTYLYEIVANNIRVVAGGNNIASFGVAGGTGAEFYGSVAVDAAQKLFFDGGGDTYLQEVSANVVNLYAGGTARFQVSSAAISALGTVGVGVYSSGSGTSTGTAIVRNGTDGQWYLTSSSRRFKENISTAVVTDAQLDAFMATAPSWWDYTGQKNGALGFIAEDLAALPLERYGFNPLVNYDAEGQIESNRDYALIAMHHLVIQRMQKEIDALKARIH